VVEAKEKVLSLVMSGLVLAGGLAATSGRGAEAEPSPVGLWKSVDDATGKAKSVVRIFEEGGTLRGRIERLFLEPEDVPDPVCDKCEGDRKGQPVRGMTIIWDLRREGDQWTGGRVLDPGNGQVYRCSVEVLDGGGRLKLRGYIGIPLLGRTQYWQRESER
jgi:uncharacterized protein (DUF2147 family)